MPVLCEGTSRMTRAASDCTSEHGKNYFDSRLMSDIEIYRQLTETGRRHHSGALGSPQFPVFPFFNSNALWFSISLLVM